MGFKACFLVIFYVLLIQAYDPNYDHQTQVYQSSFVPVQDSGELLMTPFFSPDFSALTLTNFIETAVGTIDILTPGFYSYNTIVYLYVLITINYTGEFISLVFNIACNII